VKLLAEVVNVGYGYLYTYIQLSYWRKSYCLVAVSNFATHG